MVSLEGLSDAVLGMVVDMVDTDSARVRFVPAAAESLA